MYKVLHGLCDFPEDVFQIQLAHSQGPDTALSIRSDYYYNSFVPSSIRVWNSLEETLVLTPSLQSFKLALKYT